MVDGHVTDRDTTPRDTRISVPIIQFAATDGTQLEGRLTLPDAPNGGVAVVCHPHPLHGGSMQTWMPPVLQRALVSDGWVGLRFNFRGVGRSHGSYGGGIDERADVEGAVRRVLDEVDDPTAPVLLGGWSFGANVSLAVAMRDAWISGWFGVGLPPGGEHDGLVPRLSPDELAGWTRPKLFIHGQRDDVAPIEHARAFYDAAPEPKRFHVVSGGDHYMAAHADELADTVRDFGREVLAG